jgi:hypothetical protein
MNKEATDKDTDIPYNSDPDVLDKILDELKNTGADGINIKTLWQNIDESTNPNRSYTLTLARYLNLVDSDGAKVWLTKLGNQIRFYSGDKRNMILIENLPQTYTTMCKWIKHSSGEMLASDLKAKYIEVFESMKSNIVFDRAIASFLNYCDHIGLLIYSGKGGKAIIKLTDFGKQVLDQPSGVEKIEKSDDEKNNSEPEIKDKKGNQIELSKDAIYPIKIITNDRVFDWDIKAETDLHVIDSVITSIKEGWKKLQKQQQFENSSNHIKGEKDRTPST